MAVANLYLQKKQAKPLQTCWSAKALVLSHTKTECGKDSCYRGQRNIDDYAPLFFFSFVIVLLR